MALGLVSPLLNRGVRSRWLASLPGAGSKMLVIDSNGDTSFQDIPVAAWGSITGTLSAQTDLQSALDGKLSLTGGTLTGAVTSNLGTVTSSTPALTINQTWNNAAATFSLLSATLSNTASNNDSYWVNFQGSDFWGGNNTPVFRVQGFNGQITVCGKWGDGSIRLGGQSIGCLITAVYGTGLTFAVQGSTNFTIGTHGQYGNNSIFGNWHVNNSLAFTGSGFAGYISWDASNVLALKNSTNAQTFRLYGTYTDASNYRRLYLSSTTAGAFTIGVEGAGTGASGNTLTIPSVSITTANIISGFFYEIWGNQTRSGIDQGNGFVTGLIHNGYKFTNSNAALGGTVDTALQRISAGVAGITSGQTTNFRDLMLRSLFFEGSTSAFPMLKRNGTALNFRLADDSADAPITAGAFTITQPVSTSGSPTAFTLTGAAHTTLTASTEATDVNFNLARTVQFAAGALTTQRAFRIQAPTYSFASASTITTASTLSISGAPVAGTNATITNSYALNVEGGTSNFGGNIQTTGYVQVGSDSARVRLTQNGISNLSSGLQYTLISWTGGIIIDAIKISGYAYRGINIQRATGGQTWLTVNLEGSSTAFGDTPRQALDVRGNAIIDGNVVLHRSATSTSLQVHNTYTDASNYIRQSLSFTTYSSTVHAQLAAEGAGTGAVNVPFVITPRGTGAFILGPMPDGTATGGNARGANAVDLQTSRSAATQVASGTRAIAIGTSCTASAVNTIAIGRATASGGSSLAIGTDSATASGPGSIAIGFDSITASASCSVAIGASGASSTANCAIAIGSGTASRVNEVAWGFRHTAFDVRPGSFLLSATTTNNTATALQLQNIFGSSNFTTRTGVVLHGTLHVTGVKSDGSAVAIYTRRIVLKNVGGTITLVESQTIGTDYEDNALTDLTISATSPFFQVTGITGETWKWAAWFSPTCEIAY